MTSRKLLQSKAIDIENDLRSTLRNFALKVGPVRPIKFEARTRELIKDHPDLAVIIEPVLIVRRTRRQQPAVLHRQVLKLIRDDAVSRRLMTIPGIGPVVALAFRATIEVPARFENSKAVGAVLGLSSRQHQSGERNWIGGISRCGDEMMRTRLYEAAQVMMARSSRWSWLKAWSVTVAHPSRHEEGGYRLGASAGYHYASDVGRWHRISLGQSSCGRNGRGSTRLSDTQGKARIRQPAE
jgi:transposase